jgi:hypothetical protein
MRTFYVPIMHCEKMAVTDMSFRQLTVIEFLVKEGKLGRSHLRLISWCVWRCLHGCHQYQKVPSAGRVMGTVFWDSEGCMLVEFLEKGETINAARYVQTLNVLHALRERRLKKKTVILQHDNSRPHTARLTLRTVQKNGWELLFHPSYVKIWLLRTSNCSVP